MDTISLLKNVCKRCPQKDAIIENGKKITYLEFWRKINAACKFYQKVDIKCGERILIVLPNNSNFLIYHLAALKTGAISVPLKTDYKIAEFKSILKSCQPKLLVSYDKWLYENNCFLEGLKSQINLASVDDIKLENNKTEFNPCYRKHSDLATINYSYFGDGYPKGASLSHANHIYSSGGICKHVGFKANDRFLIVLPMSHVFALSGCINTSLLRGGTIVILENYSPQAIFSAIEEYKITVLNAVPAVFEYLAKFRRKDKYNISSIRRCITGGDFMPRRLHCRFEKELKTQILQGYGLTETLPILCNPSGARNRPGTLGLPGRKDIHIKIVNEKDEDAGYDQTGEILVKSPTTMRGYYNLPHDTKRIIKGDWLYTGDLGKIDKDGFVHFCGLKKKIFNMYGNKVDPLEVKNVLLEHPSIKNANIYLDLLSDGEWIIGSKRICADVFVRDEEKISSIKIRDYCKERIAAYKIPDKFNFYSMQ